MKSILALLLTVMLLLPCAVLGETADTTPLELISRPLPIDYAGGFAPQEANYVDNVLYEDPTIRVSISYHETEEYNHKEKNRLVGYWVVDIQVGDASQVRTAAAESFKTTTSLPVHTIADRVNAVVAFNGDFFVRLEEGFAIRQGELVRDKLRGRRDVLLVDEDGDFHVSHLPQKGTLTDTVDGKKVINAFYFGPVLVENGEVPKKLPEFTFLEPDKFYARLAFCQIDHLHYKLILTTMIEGKWLGMQLRDFANLCKKEGAQIAYNLDGGNSTTLYFHGERINNQKKINFRNVPDILYFASAWNGEE